MRKSHFEFSDLNKKLEAIKERIQSSEVSIVSFDIFDTLLVRPVLEPRDIFYLIAGKLDNEKGIDFIELRYDAEKKITQENSTIYDIWDRIAEMHSLDPDLKEQLIQSEIEAESSLLYPRGVGKKLYEYAIECKKKVIATSDMYLPENILQEILIKNGYDRIEKIYVSCECKVRKDTGALYDYVVNNESVLDKKAILHIGDNYWSDYKCAKKRGIKASYLPSNLHLFFSNKHLNKKYIENQMISKDPFCRILLGYVINSCYERDGETFQNGKLTIEHFSKLFIFPVLMQISLICLNDKYINETYDKIYFAARDGYLPFKAYNILKNKYNGLPCEYFYASRQAYSCLHEKSIYDRLTKENFEEEFTLNDFIKLTILDETLLENILVEIENKKKIPLNGNSSECIKVLNQFEPELSGYFETKKDFIRSYYKDIFKSNKNRVLVFDCGYGGSISIALQEALDSKYFVDKLYLWETDENVRRDQENGTRTVLAIDGVRKAWADILYENCFSPLEGSFVGINKIEDNYYPILNQMIVSDKMKRDCEEIQTVALEMIDDFSSRIFDYMKYYNVKDMVPFISMLQYYFKSAEVKDNNLLKNILFEEQYIVHITRTLAERISDVNRTEMNYREKIVYKLKCMFNKE